jgi:hypothetical protein
LTTTSPILTPPHTLNTHTAHTPGRGHAVWTHGFHRGAPHAVVDRADRRVWRRCAGHHAVAADIKDCGWREVRGRGEVRESGWGGKDGEGRGEGVEETERVEEEEGWRGWRWTGDGKDQRGQK